MAMSFVARDAELDALHEAFRRAREAGPVTVLVGGEAGIGKSRLVAEFAARPRDTGPRDTGPRDTGPRDTGPRVTGPRVTGPRVTGPRDTALRDEADGAWVLEGGCLEPGIDGLAYAPHVMIMRLLVHRLGAERAARLLPGGGRHGLAHWLPVLGEPEGDPDPVTGRTRLFEDVLALLEGAAAERPLILIFEDLHWADPSSRELLAFLVRNLTRPGVLIVGTYRTSDLADADPLRSLVAGLVRLPNVVHLAPAPLAREEVRELLAARLGRDPAPALAHEIHRRSEGNPLFAEALADEGPATATPVPLRDLLLSGLRRLPEETRQVVRAGSVIGGTVGHELLAAVTGLDDLALEAALRPAVDIGLLRPADDCYCYLFRHDLVRQAVYEDLLPSERRRLHARAGGALDLDAALVPTGRAPAAKAAHWYAAGDRRRALIAAWRAAAAAGAAYAHPERRRMLSRVLELWERVPDAARTLSIDHVVVLERGVEAALASGEAECGVALATAAIEELGDRDASRVAALLELRSTLRHRLGEDALDDLRSGIALLPADPPSRARGRLLGMLANRLFLLSQPAEARTVATEALAAGRATGDARMQAWALVTLASLAGFDGDLDASIEMYEQAVEVARGGADTAAVLTVAIMAEADAHHGAGRHERAWELAAQSIAAAERSGLARDQGVGSAAHGAEPLVALGRWAEARALIRDSLALDPPPLFRAVSLISLGAVALAEGDLAEAERAATSARAVLHDGYGGKMFHFRLYDLEAALAIAQGDLKRADDALERAFADLDVSFHSRFAWPLLVTGARLAAELRALAVRDTAAKAHADALLGRVKALAAQLPVHGPVQVAQRATFQALTGESDWDVAAKAWRDLKQPYELACALWHAAEAAAEAGDKAGAAERLQEAQSIASGLGAVPLSKELELFATRARLTREQSADPPLAVPEDNEALGLTPREMEVLRLVADGLSNRQIAERLYISAKTSGVHVSNILAKLQVASRTEAAALAHRLRLFDADQG
ncbi:AAA family ATPase [Actinomadura barringtoniae]|uniref:AAA family ATPase n=1 Tax=Actinomadura barringtoniae TaxID=1427535 RepID=A0A939PRD4_9ACTN|nr:helix-turn-helix transcriptional regulator [Actinomadura barringtoniae]MBO2454848.1 AAA family ATPase [Actinomadura barringtoniae]